MAAIVDARIPRPRRAHGAAAPRAPTHRGGAAVLRSSWAALVSDLATGLGAPFLFLTRVGERW